MDRTLANCHFRENKNLHVLEFEHFSGSLYAESTQIKFPTVEKSCP